MVWLIAAIGYAVVHVLVGFALRGHPTAHAVFGDLSLLAPGVMAAVVIVRRIRRWHGCQRVFWGAIGAGCIVWTVGRLGWTVHELWLGEPMPWLGWQSVLSLTGSLAPVLALLALPHRGSRRAVATVTAINILGIAAIAAYMHWYFLVAPRLDPAAPAVPTTLLVFTVFQRGLVFAGFALAAWRVTDPSWKRTYRLFAVGIFVGLVGRVWISWAIHHGTYYPGSPLDLNWTLPLFFYCWAAQTATPAQREEEADASAMLHSSRPWPAFAMVACIPVMDFVVRQTVTAAPQVGRFRDAVTMVTLLLVLALFTGRAAAERAALRRADGRRRILAAAVQQSLDLVLILRADGGIEHANAAFCRAMGYERSALDPLAFRDLVASESRHDAAELFRDVSRRGVARGTLTRKRRDGSTFPTDATFGTLVDDRGAVTHVVCVERDLTEELRTREQLIHTERLSAVGQLVSGVAHELNNPLQTVIGLAELRLMDEADLDGRAQLQRILAEATRAGHIVGNLLAFARRTPRQRARGDLNEIVGATLALRAYELRVGNIDLEEFYASDVPPVSVSREEIQQVILNLILNAEQAIRSVRDRGRVCVRTFALDGHAVVEIDDDGPGVPPALSGQVFEPFFTTKELGQGTGLGLSMGIGIATAHGGSLQLIEPGGSGARFRLMLPRCDDAAPEECPGTPLVSVSDSRDVSLAEGVALPAALVVDDEGGVRHLLSRMMTRLQYSVDTAEDGRDALAKVHARRYDIILCDMRMPRMNGAEFYAELGRSYPDLHRRCIFISGDTLRGPEADRAYGRAPVLSKPFTTQQLVDTIASVLAQLQEAA